ncbi:glycosyltransferase family 2 protein [Aquirufa nivalisilvae]|uniref:glycosyltransferase family 2 protein n=1 Tax=Aquirufa nivalisilvae TaxID=2516557 RepID=UPI0022A97EFE|nr:glycosyltransferase family 2 protein [Aquirufa nivalisilvae]
MAEDCLFLTSKKGNIDIRRMTNGIPQVSFVIPVYNEESNLPTLVERLIKIMDQSPISLEAVLIDDGSRDNSRAMLKQLALADPRFHVVLLSRNHGHQLALTAGLSVARGTEGVFVLDGDLQDPPELLEEFYAKHLEGYEVVYAIREKRKEPWYKRMAYFIFYRILKKIANVDIPLDSGDFAFIGRKVVDILNQMPEESRFIRGMRTWIGFKQIGISYNRQERAFGDSKYTFSKLVQLALNGIFNFSEFPIKFVSSAGFLAIASSLLYFFYVVIKKLFIGQVIEGFTSLLFVIILFGGIQLLAIGILGEYILRIFFQSKNRPNYIIDQEICEGKLLK